MASLRKTVEQFLKKEAGFDQLRLALTAAGSEGPDGGCIHMSGLYARQCQECAEAVGNFNPIETYLQTYLRTRHSAYLFVLGGSDAEMETIKQLLDQFGYRWVQLNTGWGDHRYSSADIGLEVESVRIPTGGGYGYDRSMDDRIGSCCKGVEQVVFVECRPADDFPADQKVVLIDHHGERSGEPASIRQIISFLGLQLSSKTLRFVELVAANDVAYIPAMVALGATPEEVDRIRLMDRVAQGITPAHEAEAERAIGAKETNGRLTIVRMSHGKTATVTDRIFGQYDQLLILSRDWETNFYGDGALCAALQEKFEGWSGGSGLGKASANAFWGGYPNQKDALDFIIRRLLS